MSRHLEASRGTLVLRSYHSVPNIHHTRLLHCLTVFRDLNVHSASLVSLAEAVQEWTWPHVNTSGTPPSDAAKIVRTTIRRVSVGVLRIKFWHLVLCFVWVPSKTVKSLPCGVFDSPFQQRGVGSPQSCGSSNSSMTNLRHWYTVTN